ncbi:glycosyltransferase [Methanocalculus sp.]|uniref:glycosyltransferase family 2 protein n=1 Tax=Methanocalculus sp. TaxID=2004547 RepID=UPI00261F997C|nr:glycosyltransferase [Methanocalculus sp.]MDG6249248.1 glycosyltransferase [Methanocalculus sp.]
MIVDGPLISVVVCTYNRAKFLQDCLDSLVKQEYDNFEIIVVNGPSTDNTHEILGGFSVRVIQQTGKGGLSEARNIGIKNSKGEIIAFIDDDGVAEPNWLNELAKIYGRDDIGSVGGKILPIWHGTKPDWYSDYLDSYLSLLNYSQERREMIFPDTPFGCNMSFRREIFDRIGLFNTSLGRCPSNLLSYDETDLYHRLNETGYAVIYNPKAIVYHQIEASRLSKEWFRSRSYWNGVSAAIFDTISFGKLFLLKNMLRKITITLPRKLYKYFEEKMKKNEKKLFIHQLSIFSIIGYVENGSSLIFKREKFFL